LVLKIAHAGILYWLWIGSEIVNLSLFNAAGQIGYEYAIFSGWACEVLKD